MNTGQQAQGRWDIFCKVVDNYGDIGVCWRLARQLVDEAQVPVRLWVDDLHAFARLAPQLDPAAPLQRLGAIEVRHWQGEVEPGACAATAVLIEAFGCGLPEGLLTECAARRPPPVWINLEYLSAESWVHGAHAMASPHPRVPLVCHFFYPGFHADTGGLLAERGLLAQRQAWQADVDGPAAQGQASFWQRVGLPLRRPGELRVSLFGYPGAPVDALLDAWARGPLPVTALIPEGVFPAVEAGARGGLRIARYPFLHQDDFDRLLWSCDLNFVRGEDSLVRALWAGRPLVWQIYPQEEGAHFVKLDAFLDLWLAGRGDAPAWRGLWDAWNSRPGAKMADAAWRRLNIDPDHVDLADRALADTLLAQPDLVSRLIAFVSKLKLLE